jgi:hypothetical protein
MAQRKIDGVVEAAHYQPDGKLAWVRAYVRRGPTFSDRVKLNRDELIAQLQAGKQFYVGQRVKLKASTFDVGSPMRLLQHNGQSVVVTGEQHLDRDLLQGVPVL